MSEHREPIPSMIYNAAVGGHVTNSQQIIDENENKEQSQINAEVKQNLGQGGSVDARITQAKNDIIGGASSNGNTLKKVEDRVSPLESAVGSGGNIDSRIASAVATETSRAQAEEEALQQLYENLTQSDIIVTEDHTQVASPSANIIYRELGTTSYSDWMYYNNAWKKMAEYDNAIDDKPTAGSDNLVKSGGVKIEVDNLAQEWNFGKDGMAGNYTETVIKEKINIKKGGKYKITASQLSEGGSIWLQLRDNSDTKTLIQLILPSITEGEFTADNDYPNAFIKATCEGNNSKVVGKLTKQNNELGNVIKSYYGSGFINDFRYVSGQIKVSFAEDATIYCFLIDGTYNTAGISANSEYLLSQLQALVFDTSESDEANKIKIKNVSDITFEDLILIQVAYIDSDYKRYITGYYSDRILIDTQYENYNLHNVKQQYERDVDNKSADVLNESTDFSMLIATDLHTNTQGTIQDTPELNVLMRVDKNINPDINVNLGDTVGLGLENPNRAYYSLNDIKQSTNFIKDYYYVVGNHDYNNLSEVSVDRQPKSSIIPHKAIYNILGKLHENDVVWGSKDGMYYYKDFNDKKIRIIFLNTLDKPEEWVTVDGVEYEKYPWLPNIVSAAQINWFIDTALNFTSKGADKTNWSVIVCSHVTPAPNVPGNSASLGDLQTSNPQGVEICKIMEAFVGGTSKALSYTDNLYGGNATLNRNADFTSQGAMTVIGWFSGHNHRDYKTTINGVTYITTLCGFYTSGVDESYITMTPDTYTEFALDLLVVDKVNRTAKLKRYGAGSDRTWNY